MLTLPRDMNPPMIRYQESLSFINIALINLCTLMDFPIRIDTMIIRTAHCAVKVTVRKVTKIRNRYNKKNT